MKNIKIAKYIPLLLFFFILIAGFIFRLQGIRDNHSFWSDEAYISALARNVVTGKLGFSKALSSISYQPLFLLNIVIFFKLIGISEFAARLGPVIFGTLGIFFAFIFAKKLSNIYGGLLAAFLFSFSQLNVANSTQAKPYTYLEVLTLIFFYFLTLLCEKRRDSKLIHFLTIITLVVSSLIHFLGVLLWIPYLLFIFSLYRKEVTAKLNKPRWIIVGLVLVALSLWLFQVRTMISYLTYSGKLLPYNSVSLVREFLWRNYAFILLPAFAGLAIQKNKNVLVSVFVTVLMVTYIFLSSFTVYHFSTRYLVPLFGIFFVYFGAFWSTVGEKLLNKKSALLCLTIMVLLYVGGYKIVRKPSVYYSPNADIYGDVQNADYKSMYTELRTKFSTQNNYVIFNDVIDAQSWYMPEHLPDAFFVKGSSGNLAYGKTSIHKDNGKPIYTTLNQFIDTKKKFPKGLFVVEDWQSILPEDIKAYAKKNMKLEIKIDSLSQSPGDIWPLSVYSWGMN